MYIYIYIYRIDTLNGNIINTKNVLIIIENTMKFIVSHCPANHLDWGHEEYIGEPGTL